MTKRLLLLTKRYYTNKDLITDKFGRLYHLPCQLVENGFKVLVICVDYRGRREKVIAQSGLKYHSLPLTLTNSAIFFLKLLRYIYRFKPDAIMASGDTHFGFLGWIISKFFDLPCLFDVYDDYTAFGSNRLPFMKSFFTWTIRFSNAVTCASSPLKTKILNYNSSVKLIENGVDESLFRSISKPEARDRLNISLDDTVVGYFGSIGKNYGIENLSDAILRLQDQYPNIKLLIAGKNETKISLWRSHIDYRGLVSQGEIPFFINASDVVVIPYLPDDQINMSNPCKLAEYLACGVPVVSTRVSDIADTLSEIPQALCTPGSVDDMVSAIGWQLKNRKIVDFPKHLKWETLGDKLTKLLKEIV